MKKFSDIFVFKLVYAGTISSTSFSDENKTKGPEVKSDQDLGFFSNGKHCVSKKIIGLLIICLFCRLIATRFVFGARNFH